MAAPSVAPSIAPSIAAPSEISSALYAGHDPTYHHYQPAPHTQLPFDAGSVRERRTSHRGVGTGSSMSQVQGLLSQYTSQDGVQYYRDLAGNVKQVGWEKTRIDIKDYNSSMIVRILFAIRISVSNE